ncbi:MAG: TolC family protein [Clostridiales Family XIII bacterium]|nr:TolC family protein [Clostridiales Family XIII bacterium]
MKKKFLGVILTLVLFLGCGTVFAAEAEAPAEPAPAVIVPNMNFTGEAISLSLEDAVARITSAGPGYESALLAKETLDAQAKGQEDLWAAWRAASNAMMGVPSSALTATINPTKTVEAKIVKITRPYLVDQAVIGFEIDLNNLIYDTTKVYHSVLQAAELLRISQDNLQVQKDILSNTNKKFELGVVSKMDVLSAESAVQEAAVRVNTAESNLKSAKMSFNMQLDYPLMQNVVLTDSLEMAVTGPIDLASSVKAALATRNELNQLAYRLESTNITLESKFNSSRYSADYLTAALDVKQTEKLLKDAKTGIELEIRSKYMSIQNLTDEIAAAKKTVANAQEGYRLADLSYTAGVSTLVDVQNTQLASYQAQLGLASKTLEYNLAVSDFTIATGYGKGAAK